MAEPAYKLPTSPTVSHPKRMDSLSAVWYPKLVCRVGERELKGLEECLACPGPWVGTLILYYLLNTTENSPVILSTAGEDPPHTTPK